MTLGRGSWERAALVVVLVAVMTVPAVPSGIASRPVTVPSDDISPESGGTTGVGDAAPQVVSCSPAPCVIGTVSVGSGPWGVAYDSGMGEVFVTNSASAMDRVSVISDVSDAVVASATAWTQPEGVAYDSGKGEVFVTNAGVGVDNVSVISDASDKIVASVPVGLSPDDVAYDSVKGEVFVTNPNSNTVSVISDTTDKVVANVNVGLFPYGLAYDSGKGEIFVANSGAGNVSVISDVSNTVVASIRVGNGPWGVACDNGKGEVFVTNENSNSVSVISDVSNTVVATIPVGVYPEGLAYDSGTGEVFVTNSGAGNNNVSVISDASNAVVATVPVGSNPDGVAYDSGRGEVFVANSNSQNVNVIWDGSSHAVTFTESGLPGGTSWSVTLNGVTQSSTLSSIAFMEPNGTYAFTVSPVVGYTASPSSGSVTVSGAAQAVSINFTPGNSWSGSVAWTLCLVNNLLLSGNVSCLAGNSLAPSTVAWDSANGDIYVTNYGAHNVSVISGSTNHVVTTIPVGTGPNGAMYDDGNGDVYVSNAGSSNVSVISGSTNRVVATIPVGTHPSGVAYDSVNGDLYVANFYSANVSVISGSTNHVVATIPLGVHRPYGATYDRGNGDVYVTIYDNGTGNGTGNTVSVVNGTTNAVVATVTVGTGAYGVAYDNRNGDIYVTNRDSANVSVIDGKTNKVVATIPVQTWPWGAVFDNGNGYVYVSNKWSDNVSVIDGNTNKVVATLPVGNGPACGPTGGVYDKGNGNVYVADSYDDAVSIVATGYTVSFSQTGLPPGTSWSVILNGTTKSSTTATDRFTVPNGTYSFTVGPVPGYTASPSSGSIIVSGAAQTVSITFSLAPTYSVTFVQSGLPAGTNFSVTLSGSTQSSVSGVVTFQEADGTYSFSVGSVPGYTASPSSGTVTVAGGPAWATITFTPLPPNQYSVIFAETGLSAGTNWSVTLSGKTAYTTASSLSFSEPNGTYAYSVGSVAGYTASPSSGNVVVNGAAKTMSITFTPVTYSVTFTESGLPGGTNWSITLSGQTASSTSSTIAYSAPNGTYSFTVNPVLGYTASPSSGSVVVNGTTKTVSITFIPVTYSVTFTESGLPGGTSWQVTLGGTTGVSVTNAIILSEPNGTYSYSVGSVTGYTASPSSGAVTVAGKPVGIAITFTPLPPNHYPVTFTETGLPVGTSWSVMLNGSTSSTTASSLSFSEPNGTYAFTVGPVAGYTASPSSGNVVVNGAAKAVSVTFTPAKTSTYAVNFAESGLPVGTSLSIILNGSTLSSVSGVVTFQEVNGTYPYSVGSVPGYTASPLSGTVTVNGVPQTVSITFTQLTYLVTFTESGLPVGTNWSVTLSGKTAYTTASSLSFSEPNGTYTFTVGSVAGYTASPSSGNVVVNGAAKTMSITFTPVTYSVTFTESGLPGGTNWSITLAGQTASSTSSTIAYSAPNGTYSFTVNPVLGYTASPSSGSVNINGASKTISVNFTKSSTTTFTVTFSESGLPAGTSWSVTLNGSTQTGTGNLVFTEPNGSYPFFVGAISGYSASPSSGTIKVNGIAVSQSITFTALPPGQYSLIFSETGLPAGANWSVTVGTMIHSSTVSTISFNEVNGTYHYTVGAITGYTSSPSSGNVTVSGASKTVAIAFAKVSTGTTYTVTFTESGLPSGTSWSVTLNGSARSSTTGTITFQEVNGSYAFTVGTVSGYTVNPSPGSVKVNGGPASQNVTFTSSSSKGKTNQTTGFLGLPGDDGYIVIGAVVAAVAIATAVLLMRGRGKRPAPVSSSKEEPERTDNKGNAPSDNVHFNRDNPNVPTD